MSDHFFFDLASFPMRSKPSHKSEMVNEILFGEPFVVLQSDGTWHQIKCTLDGSIGWIDRKSTFSKMKSIPTEVAIQNGFLFSGSRYITVYPGSLFPNQLDSNSIEIQGEIFEMEVERTTISNLSTLNDLLNLSFSFLNIPYYWGGKTYRGIDCSGLIQVLFRTNGIFLPRDAYQQFDSELFVTLSFDERRKGDIVYFKNEEDQIVHTGILISPDEIVHASEMVRIDQINQDGIFRDDISGYTHFKPIVKRLADNGKMDFSELLS